MTSQFMKLPLIGAFIKRLSSNIENYGLQKACSLEIGRSETKIISFGLTDDLHLVLKNNPVIIVANHIYDIEPLAIFSQCPQRKDVYLIINVLFTGFSKNIDQYLIPVYIKHHHAKSDFFKRGSGTLVRKLHKDYEMNPETEHQNNIESIENAAKKVNKGSLLLIFPGRRGKNHAWRDGIGHLINQVSNPNTYIIKAYIKGSSNWDFLRLLPNVGKLLPKIQIHFASPSNINEYKKLNNGKKITKKLEEEYNQWISTIK